MNENEITWRTNANDEVVVFQDVAGEWCWHVRNLGNHEVEDRGESHPRKADAIEAALRHHPRIEVDE